MTAPVQFLFPLPYLKRMSGAFKTAAIVTNCNTVRSMLFLVRGEIISNEGHLFVLKRFCAIFMMVHFFSRTCFSFFKPSFEGGQ